MKSISKTPAPAKDRIKGSKVNPKGSASSEKSATQIKFDAKTIIALNNKLKEFREKNDNKNITLNDLKAVYRRGSGAYSSSHRPTISGGKPNSRNAWAMARVNKFLLKAGGTKVKKAYVQDDDLMKYNNGGEIDKLIDDGVVELKMFSTTNEHSKIYGFDAENPLYVQSLIVSESNRMKGIGTKVMEYIIEYADKNGHDVIFGHITQKAEPNIDVIKSMLQKSGFNTIDGNNDFYKKINVTDMKYDDGGEVGQDIKCRRCGWEWNTSQSEEYNKYVCRCGFDNRMYYDVDPIGYADGGLLAQQGTLYTKDKNKKLEYYKKGNDYVFKVYDVENNTNENEALMNYNQFINYLYSELYIDEKYADGGEVGYVGNKYLEEKYGHLKKKNAKFEDLPEIYVRVRKPRMRKGKVLPSINHVTDEKELGVSVFTARYSPNSDFVFIDLNDAKGWEDESGYDIDTTYEYFESKNLDIYLVDGEVVNGEPQLIIGYDGEVIDVTPMNNYIRGGDGDRLLSTENFKIIGKLNPDKIVANIEYYKEYKYQNTSNTYSGKELKKYPKYKDGGEVDDKKKTYAKWKSLVNMSYGEIKKFYDSKEGKDAGLSTTEANKQGINSGRESARMIMNMKTTPKDKWTDTMWKWANKQISFISRMSGMQGELYDDKGNKTRKHTSLLIWGHNPKKSSSMKYENGGLTEKQKKEDFIKKYIDEIYGDDFNTFKNSHKNRLIKIAGIYYERERLKELPYKNYLVSYKIPAGAGLSETISARSQDEVRKLFRESHGKDVQGNMDKIRSITLIPNKNKMADGGEMNLEKFDWNSVYNWSEEDEQKFKEESIRIKEEEMEEWYQKSSWSKKYAPTYKDAVNKTLENYIQAKKNFDDWSSRQYKANKTNVFLGGDDVFGESRSIGSINEGRKQSRIRGAKMVMDESLADLKELGLTEQEITDLINKNSYKKGGELQGLTQSEIDTNVHNIATKFKLPLEYINSQLKLGIKFEMEHTKDKSIASKIALDHLNESPYYYQKLTEMEKELDTMKMDADTYLPKVMSAYKNGGEVDMIFKLNTPTKQPTKLNYIQQILVRTTEFKKWFGDWEKCAESFLQDNKSNFLQHYKNCSIVIDLTTLEPQVVYHGTNFKEEFYTFDVTKKEGVGRPYGYFADNIEYSQNFTTNSKRGQHGLELLYKCFLNIRNPFMAITEDFYDELDNQFGWALKIAKALAKKNYGETLTLEQISETLKVVMEQIGSYIYATFGLDDKPFWLLMARDTKKEFKYFLMSHGFDGVRYAEEFKGVYDVDNPAEFTKAWTIFDANQVKLADGRNIDFDPFKEDIRYEEGGSLTELNQEDMQQENMSKAQMLRNTIGVNKFAEGGTVKGDGKHTNDAKKGGFFDGRSHAEGGIKAVNKDTGQMLEVEGNEVIINKRSVADDTKREFEGKMMTNREILSTINEMGGGVSFKEGGEINEKSCKCMGKKYKFGGNLISDYDIVKELTTSYNDVIKKPISNSINYVENLINKINGKF